MLTRFVFGTRGAIIHSALCQNLVILRAVVATLPLLFIVGVRPVRLSLSSINWLELGFRCTFTGYRASTSHQGLRRHLQRLVNR